MSNEQGPTTSSSTSPWLVPVVAVGVVVFFLGLTTFLLTRIEAPEQAWSRLMVLFSSVEAIVLLAAGSLFGYSVQSGRTRDQVHRARVAESERDEFRNDAEVGTTLESALRGASVARPTSGAAPHETIGSGAENRADLTGQEVSAAYLLGVLNEVRRRQESR